MLICAARNYDIEGMHLGTISAGRIGVAVLRRLEPFGVHLHYSDSPRLSPKIEEELDLTFHADAEALMRAVDIIDVRMRFFRRWSIYSTTRCSQR